MIFDSHAHYDDDAFDEDKIEVLSLVKSGGIGYILNAGTNIQSSIKSIELAKEYDFIYAAVGIHPQDADGFDEDSINILKEMCRYHKVRAVGEIGLDYYYEGAEKITQKKVFEEQINLALELNLPIIVHDRDAHSDIFELIRKYINKGLSGVLHCYSGSAEMAKEYADMGFYIGFTGVITFKNAKKSLEVLKQVPMDRILIETDCPYMAPVPLRGKRNDSRYLKYVVEKACEILEVEHDYFENLTCNNARSLFGI
jgi:TatD DNase family protein